MGTKTKESKIGDLIRVGGIVLALFYMSAGGQLIEEGGLIIGLVVGIINCFFAFGFAIIVDAAKAYIDTLTPNNKESSSLKTSEKIKKEEKTE